MTISFNRAASMTGSGVALRHVIRTQKYVSATLVPTAILNENRLTMSFGSFISIKTR